MTGTLEFTGERFTPECVREIWYEHVQRYAFATGLVAGKRVLDAACGEGYGSALLARSAASVDGVDLSDEAVRHAQGRYGAADNLSFHAADVTRLPFPDDHFDRIVSFETLEHLEPQDAMLAEFRRVLRDDGVLIVSSPDRAVYSDEYGNDNAFHVRELYRDELEALLGRHFPAHRLFGQKLVFHSAIWALDGVRTVGLQQGDPNAVRTTETMPRAAMYYIALCAAEEALLPDIGADLWLFDDADESVYAHYHGEIRRNMAAGGIIADRDREIERLKAALAAAEKGPAAAGTEQAARPEALGESASPGRAGESRAPSPSSWWRRLFSRTGSEG